MIFNIRRQFLAYTLGIVLAVGAAITAKTLVDSHEREFRDFSDEAKIFTNTLASSLVNDLYFFDLHALTQKLDIVSINPDIVEVQILDAKGVPIAKTSKKGSAQPPSLPADPVESLLRTARSAGDRVAYMAAPILMPDGTVLGSVAVSYSLEHVYEEIEEIATSIAVTIGLAILLAGLLALLAGWYFARPILAIKDAALAVSQGSLQARSTVKRNDELGLLGDAINAMADGLVNRLSEIERTQQQLAAAKNEAEKANRQISELNQDLERRVAERSAELAAAQQSLMQKERLSALGQLTATVAHELRNPLSVIQNTLFIMKESLAGKGGALDRPVARIERSIGRCNRIISDLLDYSRHRDLQYSDRHFDDWVAALLAEQSPPANIAIEGDLQAGSIVAHFDTDRLRRVIINLIDNAVQALTEKPPAVPHIVLGTRRVEDGVELFVRDNGPGIPAEVLPKVFEPLFSTRSFGTGLGLPTVKQIIEQHGGRIDVSSEPGAGTLVRVFLPILTERTAA